MNETIGSCAGLYLAIGAVAALVGGAFMLWFMTYQIPTGFRAQAPIAFGLMVISVAAGFIGLLPEGIMFAHHDFVRRNMVRVGGVLLRLCLTIGLLRLHASLVVLASIQIFCLAADISVSCFLIRRRHPAIRISLADFNFAMVRRIFAFSMYVLLLTAGARLSFETDALVIGAFQDVGAIPFYVVANSLVVYLMEFVIAIAAVVSPMATKLKTEGREDELEEMFLKWTKVALSLTFMAGLFLFVFGPRLIGWWIDSSFEQPAGQVLQILVASCFIFLPVRGVAVPMLMGLGKPKIPAFGFLGAGLLNLILSLLLVKPFGLAGVAVGTAVPNVLFAGFVMVVACRELHITLSRCLRYVVPRATVGALPVLLLLLWFKVGLRVQSLAGLVAAGFAMVLLFTLTWIFFVYRNDPYVDLKPHLVRFGVVSRA